VIGETEKSQKETQKCFCGKEHIDLRKKLKFIEQSTSTGCKRTCDNIISSLGIESEGATVLLSNGTYGAYYQLAVENGENTALIYNEMQTREGLKYLDLAISNDYPVVVGVNYIYRVNKKKNKDINELTTDHFVVIVGRYCENSAIYYRFWDVGTQFGAKNDYKFILDSNGHLYCPQNYNGVRSDVTQIRRNFDTSKKYIIDINKLIKNESK
jgi:hypothetical protein